MCQRLTSLMDEKDIRQHELVRHLKISATSVCLLVRKGLLPKRNTEELLATLEKYLTERGCTAEAAAAAINELRNPPATGADNEDTPMIIRRQSLPPSTRRHFKLLRNPFDDPKCPEDVFLCPETRYVREVLYDAAVNGNFLAIVGQSGSGKTTLREELLTRLATDHDNIVVIEPYILSLVDSAVLGKPLSAEHITAAICASVAPGVSMPIGREARARRMHKALVDSARSGMRHVLIIEEAHDLPRHLIKSLKRFWELKDGQQRLLSIVLVGQPELETKLSSSAADIREVVQRCDLVRLGTLEPAPFLTHRFARAGGNMTEAFEPDALEALRQRLIVSRDRMGNIVYEGYPLAISNLAMACMNEAARLGERVVTADVVRQVQP